MRGGCFQANVRYGQHLSPPGWDRGGPEPLLLSSSIPAAVRLSIMHTGGIIFTPTLYMMESYIVTIFLSTNHSFVHTIYF